MNVQKIKEQLKNKSAIDEVQPKLTPDEQEEEDKNWKNPAYMDVIDYELTDDGNGNGQNILNSLTNPDIDYKSAKSMSQFREFFYDMVKTYERFENNQ